MMRMHLKQKHAGLFVYSLGLGNRIVYGLCALAMGLGAAIVLPGQPFTVSSIVPLAILALSLVGAGYRDTWIFNVKNQKVTHFEGWACIVRHSEFGFADVTMIRIAHFVKGTSGTGGQIRPRGRNISMVVFTLILADGSQRDVEILGERASAGRTQDAGRRIALATGICYEEDREHDQAQPVSIRDL